MNTLEDMLNTQEGRRALTMYASLIEYNNPGAAAEVREAIAKATPDGEKPIGFSVVPYPADMLSAEEVAVLQNVWVQAAVLLRGKIGKPETMTPKGRADLGYDRYDRLNSAKLTITLQFQHPDSNTGDGSNDADDSHRS